MNICGKKVIIRAIEDADAEIFQRAINDSFLEYFETGCNFPISLNEQKNWIANNRGSNTDAKFAIEYEGVVVGYTNILNIDWKNRSAWNGIKLFGDENRGKGLGMDAVMAIMRFCFEELGLNRLEGQILDYNKASYKLYVEKCGWSVEGTKRQCAFKGGKYHDGYMVSILKKDYQSLNDKIGYWD